MTIVVVTINKLKLAKCTRRIMENQDGEIVKVLLQWPWVLFEYSQENKIIKLSS